MKITKHEDGKLFKFMPFSIYSLQLLISREFYFGPPDLLNDPFEADFFIKNIQDLQTKPVIDILSRNTERFLSLFPDDRNDAFDSHLQRYEAMRLTKEPHYFSKELYNYFNKTIKNKFGTTSFSKKPHSLTMWAHYADSHKGFVIIFDRNKLEQLCEPPVTSLFEVSYNGIPRINVQLDEGKLKLNNNDESLLLHKLQEWAGEEEVRIIKHVKNRSRFTKFDADAMLGIIYGSRMEMREMKTISTILKDLGSSLTFYLAMKNRRHNNLFFSSYPYGIFQ